jgi:hypothetical protein
MAQTDKEVAHAQYFWLMASRYRHARTTDEAQNALEALDHLRDHVTVDALRRRIDHLLCPQTAAGVDASA